MGDTVAVMVDKKTFLEIMDSEIDGPDHTIQSLFRHDGMMSTV